MSIGFSPWAIKTLKNVLLLLHTHRCAFEASPFPPTSRWYTNRGTCFPYGRVRRGNRRTYNNYRGGTCTYVNSERVSVHARTRYKYTTGSGRCSSAAFFVFFRLIRCTTNARREKRDKRTRIIIRGRVVRTARV